MDLESDHSSSPSIDDEGLGGGGVGAVTEDFVHVDDGAAGGADSSFFGEASMVGSEWRGEGNDDFLSRSGIGGEADGDGGDEAAVLHDGGVARGGEEDVEERKELPEELARRIVKLTCDTTAAGGGICDVYLVGTAHVSTESCEEVQTVISFLKPQVVFIELCSSRITILRPQNLKVASQLEVFPGAEFRVAFEEAMKYGGKVILGDRPVQITLRRTWAKMPLWHKTKLIASMLFQAVSLPSPKDFSRMLKEMDDADVLTLCVQEMSKTFPTLMETLVQERDKYMSSTLLRVASKHSSVVAVVGKGHIPGIKKYWKQPVEVNELLTIPTRKSLASMGRILTTVGVTVAGAAIVSGVYLSIKK
ncbi:OLC1v1036174C1 [Oldenlandia corymbosa var. corymbosa]|uniref:OLC1v1036174C1 n=1 Tax=Oldenlandia corymbosa var. corymbosa TaxID=529605 RepID=A0AAV1CV45_OLDCO|nr:OLC1v1036174C1 [Oldenlandia corymbosa var. corymbosa]